MPIELSFEGARAVILPEYGGRLHQLAVPVGGVETGLLVTPESPERYPEKPMFGGSFPMAPWLNRVRDGRFTWQGREYQLPLEGDPNAIHGRAFRQPWQVVARTARVCELSVTFDGGWPWAGRAWQRYELAAGALRMKMEVRSERELFPAGCGWHPWFKRALAGGEDARVRVPATQRYVLEAQLPTGELVEPSGDFDFRDAPLIGSRTVDDCYTGLTGPLEIEWDALALRMSVECPVPHAMLYTEPTAVCLEPQTCAPDAFNLAAAGHTGDGTAIVAPGRPLSLASTWEWSVR